jgi:hypothetical protein
MMTNIAAYKKCGAELFKRTEADDSLFFSLHHPVFQKKTYRIMQST